LIVRDRTPPQLECPTDFVVSEEPADSGAAVVTYSTRVQDTCDQEPSLVCQPPSGSSFPVGDTTVHCVARDSAGNQTQCAFSVRVVPRTIQVGSLADAGPGSLRQAMLDANAAAGSNTINFGFTGNTPHTIHLVSALPAINEALFIDGQSQPTFAGTPVVALNGLDVPPDAGPGIQPAAAAPPPDGLLLTSPGNVVRGLILYGFSVGIRVAGPGGNLITGNIIGSDQSGT